ncbi:DUF317 domain-containing protein [Streptomyces sp. NPDC026294]|uniref:DUF317 domain-containing protein n=1 Tax=Streptomyces sp. NPDC026294 TaxID=3155362 RepID=UPI0033F6D241
MPYDPDAEQRREYHVSPRYLAGSSGVGDPGFAPVGHWPHHHLDDGPCQLIVTSPDHRIRIRWFGDDYNLWKITAAADAASPPEWTATFNQNIPPEIVAGLTAALAHDWDAESDRFLVRPTSKYWADSVRPLAEAGWKQAATERGTVKISSPDKQAGAWIDTRHYGRDDETMMLWAGPPGYLSRAEAVFTSGTPAHLVAATAAAMADPAPVTRERHMIHRQVAHLVRLTPVEAPVPAESCAPTPLDVRRTAVSAAVQRASRDPRAAARVHAARIRTSAPSARTTPAATSQPPDSLPSGARTPTRHRR